MEAGWERASDLEVKGVVGVRHQPVLIGALQFEAMCDPAVRCLAVTVEVGEAVAVSKLFEVFVGAVHSTCAQELHHTCSREGERFQTFTHVGSWVVKTRGTTPQVRILHFWLHQ